MAQAPVSKTAPKKSAPADPAAAVLAELKSLRTEIDDLKKPRTKAVGGTPASALGVPHVTTGPLGERPYSFLRAAAYAAGSIPEDQAKEEVQLGIKLKSIYKRYGFAGHAGPTFMIPYAVDHIPQLDQESEQIVGELKQKMAPRDWRGSIDPDEMDAIDRRSGGAMSKRLGMGSYKALGVQADTAGGVLVGFPSLMELIDIQRNLEAFPNAGATETTLPPNGRAQYPKLTGGSTAYWLGEGATGTSSQVTTGYLDLVAKKLFILTYINNELLKFNTISAEAMVRLDMARVGAIAADLAFLQGTGGTQPLGLINYPSSTSWTFPSEKLIAYTVTANTFAPGDAANMVELLPDPVQEPTAWIMRRDMWSKIINRRSDAVTTGDAAGPFIFWIDRGNAGNRPEYELYGTKVVRTSQVSNTRSSTKTYVIVGFFPDWIIARSGVMEFLASNLSDTAMTNDQTLLRGIQYVDAGARHAGSFVFADNVNIS